MPMSDRRCKVINHRGQPVELHWEGGTAVLPPYGATELDAAAESSPQVQALAARRFLSVEPAAAAGPEGGVSEPRRRHGKVPAAPARSRPRKQRKVEPDAGSGASKRRKPKQTKKQDS